MTGSGSISVVVAGTNPADVQNADGGRHPALSNKNDFPDLLNVKSDLATTASEVEIDVRSEQGDPRRDDDGRSPG